MKKRNEQKRTKRILLPIGERELISTGGRLPKLAERLASQGYSVDLLAHTEALYEKLQECCKEGDRVKVLSTRQDERFWTMIQRDRFAKTFIRLTHDIVIPGTDMKFWKATGFDDFLWNVSPGVYPKITQKYDLVLLPIPSVEEGPSTSCDVFFTHVIYYAKENKVPVAGLQIYPVCDNPPIYANMLDYFVVREEFERDFLQDSGIQEDRIFLLDDRKDNYCLSLVEDPYRALVIDSEFSFGNDQLGIVLVNHPMNRIQLNEIIDLVAEIDVKKYFFFCFVDYAVKELHEKDIFNDFIMPNLKNKIRQFYTVEAGGIIRALMLSDVIIATTYIMGVGFAKTYKKKGIVYNPLKPTVSHFEDVLFTHSKQAVKEAILEQYQKKQRISTIVDIVGRILK